MALGVLRDDTARRRAVMRQGERSADTLIGGEPIGRVGLRQEQTTPPHIAQGCGPETAREASGATPSTQSSCTAPFGGAKPR
eukprot:1729760-Prymnesium_polylepis.1